MRSIFETRLLAEQTTPIAGTFSGRAEADRRLTASASISAEKIDTSSARALPLCYAIPRPDDLRAEVQSRRRFRLRKGGLFRTTIVRKRRCDSGHATTEVRVGIGVPVSGARRSPLGCFFGTRAEAAPADIRVDVIGSFFLDPGTERSPALSDFPGSGLRCGWGPVPPASPAPTRVGVHVTRTRGLRRRVVGRLHTPVGCLWRRCDAPCATFARAWPGTLQTSMDGM